MGLSCSVECLSIILVIKEDYGSVCDFFSPKKTGDVRTEANSYLRKEQILKAWSSFWCCSGAEGH